MSQAVAALKSIEKEKINVLDFPKGEILSSPQEVKERKQRIQMAIMYGNEAFYKVKVFFKDADSTKFVHTTIWDADGKFIYLKDGVKIPVNRILEVKFP